MATLTQYQTKNKYTVKPCTLKEANQIVEQFHRHHKPVIGHRFSLKLIDEKKNIIGIVITGRPVCRNVDYEEVLEITRCATDGTFNAISQLYGAVCRAAKAMGFLYVQTYTLPEEGGSSLKASGFSLDGETSGGQWKHTDGKDRRTDQPIGKKWRWVKCLF